MKIQEYYEQNPEAGFFHYAASLYEKSEIGDFLHKFDFTKEQTNSPEFQKIIDDLKTFITYNLDELHFLLVRLATICELTLKGISLSKKLDIFKLKSKKLIQYDEIDIKKCRTYEFYFFISNLDKLLDENFQNKYRKMFFYFLEQRNDLIHFVRQDISHDLNKMFSNFKLMKEFFEEVIKTEEKKAF